MGGGHEEQRRRQYTLDPEAPPKIRTNGSRNLPAAPQRNTSLRVARYVVRTSVYSYVLRTSSLLLNGSMWEHTLSCH